MRERSSCGWATTARALRGGSESENVKSENVGSGELKNLPRGSYAKSAGQIR